MVSSILTHAGYSVGFYTSPHLFSFTERIQANGRPIAEDAFARMTEILKPEVETVNQQGDLGELTTFELLTALAFTYYREIAVDYQVMETGLGGRLDATNVVKPEVGIITSISYDHMDILGNTLTQIATEKAGIIKPGKTVVCSPQFPEAMAVIERICREREARLIRVGSDVTWQSKSFHPQGQSFKLKGLRREYDLTIPLIGEHQLENAANAVATAELLTELGANISPENITAGLARVYWPGRLQILRRKPWFIVDSAHNTYSLKRLGEALRKYFDFDRMLLICGCSSDKDTAGLTAEMAALTSKIIVTNSRNPRAVAPAILVKDFSRLGITPDLAPNIPSAVELALEQTTPNDLICATGSIFIVAEVMEYLAKLS